MKLLIPSYGHGVASIRTLKLSTSLVALCNKCGVGIMASTIEVFLCYAQEDEGAMRELTIHLGVLKRQGYLTVWHDREIAPGTEWKHEIDEHLNSANIILLLISQYFVDSDYCYLVQMEQAVQRHERGQACVIPVILRPVYYEKTPFARLQPLPSSRKPVLGSGWPNRDEAFYDVAEGIRKAAEKLLKNLQQAQ